jgi:6-phosphogluconate dehydrogenase
VARLKPYLNILAPVPEQPSSVPGAAGWIHTGVAGSGHFVKMVHNGIEYGMMQAYAEGFAVIAAKKEFDLDLAAIGEVWRHGSVVRSWLLDLTTDALRDQAGIQAIEPVVADSGEGRWTALEAIDLGVPAPVMSLALMMRYASQGDNDFSARLLAKMRQGFGGHPVVTKK